ncbi:hypothetical protein H5T51_01255 [Candidatus Bathyarchaeota archaeon]|nr:hypothetical protein [Candidatus Bathyarchaeota archaeon]
MSYKAKKTASSLSHSLLRFYRRISTFKPSNLMVTIIILAIVVFLFGGGLYSIIVKPYPAVYYGGRFLFIYPQLSEQFVSDSIIATTFYAIGVIGVLLMYQSTKYAYKPRQAYMMFIIGVSFLILTYVSLEAILHYWKGV